MRKKIIIISGLVLLSLLATVLIISNSKSTLSGGEKDFAISDTAAVTKIFLTDKNNRSVLLERKTPSQWKLNDSFFAQKEMVEQLLKTMMFVSVKAPVPVSMHNSVISRMATLGIKVEIYMEVYRVDFLGIQLWPYEKLVKTYYVGDNTMDNGGTFMMIDGAEMPFITYIPGFTGFLQSRYSTNPYDWRDHTVFQLPLTEISEVQLMFPGHPEWGFNLNNPDNKNYVVNRPSGERMQQPDTLRIINYLSGFQDVRFESFLNDLDKNIIDSITANTPLLMMTVIDKKKQSNSLKFWRIKAPAEALDLEGNPIIWDRERLHAQINGKDLVLVQYFVFGRLIRNFDYFSKTTQAPDQPQENFRQVY